MLSNIKFSTFSVKAIKFSIVFAMLICSHAIKAQESCTQTLVDAEKVYSKGQIELVPEILETCLTSGFSKDEKVEAYRLLTLCHLYYNRTAEATETMHQMLKIDAEYKIRDIDPSEFVNLHGTFRTTPMFILGVKGGFGGLNIYDNQNYNDINSADNNGYYNTNNTIYGGLSAEAPIIPEFSIVLEAYYNTYSYVLHKINLEYALIDFTETVSGIEVPLLLQWNVLKDRSAIPYLNVGVSFNYMINSTGKLTRNDTLVDRPDRDLSIPDGLSDLTSTRNVFNYGITGGAGVRIKDVIGRGYITLDVRYTHYMKTLVNSETRADSESLSYGYLYADNSIKFENLSIFLGYKLPIYDPKQKRSARKSF